MKRFNSACWLACLHAFALAAGTASGQSYGAVVGWGSQVIAEPSALQGIVGLAVGDYHNLGVKSDGTIVTWGSNDDGQCDIPEPNCEFVAVDGGYDHSVGLKSDGTAVARRNLLL